MLMVGVLVLMGGAGADGRGGGVIANINGVILMVRMMMLMIVILLALIDISYTNICNNLIL